jgi:hypothetical protein
MRSMFRSALAAFVAVLALGAVAATAAQATEGPFWKVQGSRLTTGETLTIEGAIAKEYVLKFNPLVGEIKCTSQKLEKAKLRGSAGANPGTALATVVFEGCTAAGNGEGCKVEAGKIKTVQLTETLARENHVPVKGEKLLALFEAQGGVWTNVKWEGTQCKIKELAVEGSLAAEVWEGGEKPVKLEETETEAEKGFVSFPTVAIKKVWVETGGGKEVKPRLETAGTVVGLTGRTELKATGFKWGVFTK